MYTDFVCCFALAALASVLILNQWTPHQWMVGATLLGLALIRIKAWKTIIFQAFSVTVEQVVCSECGKPLSQVD
jgi:hypothetical protein